MTKNLDLFGDDPDAPFVKGSPTSKAAARAIGPSAKSVQGRILAFLKSQGEHGATDDEMERVMKIRHQTVSAQRRELVKANRVENTGRIRKTQSGRSASVWRLKNVR